MAPSSEIDGGALMRHAAAFAQWVKLSGTAEEAESLRYVQEQLDGLGFQTELIHHPAYISLPGRRVGPDRQPERARASPTPSRARRPRAG